MTVVDVDTHWEISRFAPGQHPLEPWLDPAGRDRVEQLAHGIAGDLLDALPPRRRPSGRTLMPGLVELAERRGGPVVLHPEHDSTAAERVAWMDRVGIGHCLVSRLTPSGLRGLDQRPAGIGQIGGIGSAPRHVSGLASGSPPVPEPRNGRVPDRIESNTIRQNNPTNRPPDLAGSGVANQT